MERIPIVDENDSIIEYKERESVLPSDIYRATGLWITNSKGEILLARRALTKRKSPGMWGPAAAGTVEEGETYESNVVKEAEEELGLSGIEPEIWFKQRITGESNFFGQWFKLQIDVPVEDLVLDPREVMDARWFTKDELIRLAETESNVLIKSLQQWVIEVLKS
jgi:isopentenyldiphosphate isomerase